MNIVRIKAEVAAGMAAVQSETNFVAEQISVDGEVIKRIAHLTLSRDIGSEVPRYWYYVGDVAFSSQDLPLYRRDRMLVLGNDLVGMDEISNIGCDLNGASARESEEAQLALIQAVLHLLWTERGQQGSSRLIAELAGPRSDGESPFWNGLGRHFCPTEPEAMRARHGRSWDAHAAALMPQQPVLVSLLSEPAQRSLATAAKSEHGLEAALHKSGFKYARHVCIHDGGPVYEYEGDAKSEPWTAVKVRPRDQSLSDELWLLSAQNYRTVWLVPAQAEGGVLFVESVIEACIQSEGAIIRGKKFPAWP